MNNNIITIIDKHVEYLVQNGDRLKKMPRIKKNTEMSSHVVLLALAGLVTHLDAFTSPFLYPLLCITSLLPNIPPYQS